MRVAIWNDIRVSVDKSYMIFSVRVGAGIVIYPGVIYAVYMISRYHCSYITVRPIVDITVFAIHCYAIIGVYNSLC